MTDFLKFLIPFVLVLLFSAFQLILNEKKNRRIRQLPMIFIAFFSMLIGVVLWLVAMNYLAEIIEFFTDENRAAEILSAITNADIAIINIALLGVFAIVRHILRPIVTKTCKKKPLLEAFAMDFYEYDSDLSEWFLKTKWISFRKFFFSMVCGLSVASAIFVGLTWSLGSDSVVWLFLVPCAAIVVLNECYNYINGQTKEEFESSIGGEDSKSKRISNYYKLREVFEKMLPEPLLSASSGAEFVGKESANDLVEKLKKSEIESERITGKYFEIDERYKEADIDCVQATVRLMNRKNVVMFNPFYRDLGLYLTLPFASSLLKGKKCLVLCSRKSNAEDVKQWLSEILSEYSHMNSLWRVDYLSKNDPNCEVGILTFSQIYDKKVLSANKEFLAETDFVFMVEPSMMLNTSQVALSIINQEMNVGGNEPVYCICDRIVEGLVDTLSHTLHAKITDVVAMPVPRCNYTAMSWDADGDFKRQDIFEKQTKYLGGGVELSAIAVKNQIPKVSWYSETKAPMKDIKWITGQYHNTICKYMNLTSQQSKLYEKIDFISNLWSCKAQDENFLIVEDEFCNMFSTIRNFLSRGSSQAFVNVLSENYMLRDYMRCNKQMFMTNPNAIASLVPDYSKTERNVVLKLIIMMTLRPVKEQEVIDEFRLIGEEIEDAFETLTKLLAKYTYADNSIFTVKTERIIVDEFTTQNACVFSIAPERFELYFADSLKNAYFILEEEIDEGNYIDAKLFGHVTQVILPGQFVTYDGKYYVAKYVSPQSGVVLRRASAFFDGRKYYRQVRNYHLNKTDEFEIVSYKKVGDIEFEEIKVDLKVETTGYLEMKDAHDLKTAKLVDFSKDKNVSDFFRQYHNKSVLRIKLPETNENTRYTISILLSEMFKSIFPDGWQYISVMSKRPKQVGGMLNYLVSDLDGDLDDEYIYIVEDSDIDLGLINAVEKNFDKFMDIIADYVQWHYEKMRESEHKWEEPEEITCTPEEVKKKGFFTRIKEKLKKIFGRKKPKKAKEKPEQPVEEPVEEPAEQPVEEPVDAPVDEPQDAPQEEPVVASMSRTSFDVADGTGETGGEDPVQTAPRFWENPVIEPPKFEFKPIEVASELGEEPIEETPKLGEEAIEESPELGEEPIEETPESGEEPIEEVPQEGEPVAVPEPELEPKSKKEKKKKNIFSRALEKIRNKFKRKKKVEEPQMPEPEVTGTDPHVTIKTAESEPKVITCETLGLEHLNEWDFSCDGDPDLVHADDTDIFENAAMPIENEFLEAVFKHLGLDPVGKTRYQRECFLNFGFDEIDTRIELEDVRKYLRLRGWSVNERTVARKRQFTPKTGLDLEANLTCDFCQISLDGASYEELDDGRVRCNDCSATAIKDVREFKVLFNKCLSTMCDFYEIKISVPISVKTVDAHAVAKGTGRIFKPSPEFDGRVLGYAQQSKDGYSIVIENGSPRLATTATTVHEATHIWQYLNWNEKQVEKLYKVGNKSETRFARLVLFEGMAKWSEIQYLYQIGETAKAMQSEAMTERRNDPYGIGFNIFREQYPLTKDCSLLQYTPFRKLPVIDPKIIRDATNAYFSKN